jgi:hypothetical protein
LLALALAAGVGTACDSADQDTKSPEEALASIAANLTMTCTKDPVAIAGANMYACISDDDCFAAVPGTFCNQATATCDSECDGAARTCSGGLTCDCSGRCVADAPPLPTAPPPTLSLSKDALDLAVGTTPVAVDLTVKADARYAPGASPALPMRVYLHVDRPSDLPTATPDSIQVSCSSNPADTAAFGAGCGLTTWSFTAVPGTTDRYNAMARVFVRRNPAVPATTTETDWDVSIVGPDFAGGHDNLAVTLLSTTTVPRDGNYIGTLTAEPEPGTSDPDRKDFSIPVTGYVTPENKVVIVGRSSLLAGNAAIRLGGGYDIALFSGYTIGVDSTAPTFIADPRFPRVTATVSLTFPLPSVTPSPNKMKRTFALSMTRSRSLTAARCPCTATGYTCDAATNMCFKGVIPDFVTGAHPAPANATRPTVMRRWAAETRQRLNTAFDSLKWKLFDRNGGPYASTRSRPSGTKDVLFDVAGFDDMRTDANELGYQLCRNFFSAGVSIGFQGSGATCNNGPRATNRSDDCPSGSTFVVDQWGLGSCKKANGTEVDYSNVCASLYDVNRQGFGHTWKADHVGQCPKTAVADLAALRRDYVPCFRGRIYGSGPFADQDTLDPDYDYVMNGKDLSCRSIAKRAWGYANKPTNDELNLFMTSCYTVSSEAVFGGQRGVLYLCPVAGSLVGPFAADTASERMQCLPGLADTADNLDSAVQNGNTLPVSGDKGCGAGSSTPPSDVPLYHLRDRNATPLTSETQSSLFWACMNDLERDPNAGTWQQYFGTRTCISPERFLFALEQKTTGLSSLLQPGTDGGDAKLVRSLQQWLGVHAFVITQGIEEMKLAGALSAPPPSGQQAMTWARIDTRVNEGLALMLDPDVQKLLFAYPGLSKAVAGGTGAQDFDRSVALPISLANTITSAYDLVEAQLSDARFETYMECRGGGASTARNEALSQTSALTRTLEADEVLLAQLWALAQSGGAPGWATKWTEAIDRLNVARARALTAMEDLRACKNPLGIPDNYVPLFFGDLNGTNARYFGSSDYLLAQARGLISDATTSLTTVRSSWLAQRAARFEENQTVQASADRVAAYKTEANHVIADLCGFDDVGGTSLFDRYNSTASNRITPQNCYIDTSRPECASTERPTSCYRGLIGEAAAAIVSAEMDIDLARDNWIDAQERFDLRNRQCARIQHELTGNNNLIQKHEDHMRKLREAKRGIERLREGLHIMAYSVKAVFSSGITAEQDGKEVLWDYWLKQKDDKIQDAETSYSAEMQIRLNDQRIKGCFDEVDTLKVGIDTAYNVIARRAQDVEAARVRFDNGIRKLEFSTSDAKASVARETGRTYLPIGSHNWDVEEREKYLTDFARAQRISYLALVALEYDLQQSLAGRDEILKAKVPAELSAIVGTSAGAGLGSFTRRVGGQMPAQQTVVLSLSSLLGYSSQGVNAGSDVHARDRLRAYLTSPRAAMYDRTTGNYLGQGVRFSIADLPLDQRCSERIWRVAASVQASNETADGHASVILYKARNFASRDCDGSGDLRYASTRDEVGLFWPPATNGEDSPRNHVRSTVKATMRGDMNTLPSDFAREDSDGSDPYPGSSNELALTGVYGEYVLLFTPAQLAGLSLGSLNDVLLRFDVLTVGDAQEPN